MSEEGRTVTPRELDVLSPRSFSLWFAVLGPPLIWGAQIVIGDLLFELGCGPAVRGGSILGLPLKGWSLVMTAVFASSAVLGFLLSLRAYRILRRIHDGEVHERATAFAMAGMAVGVVFFILMSYSFLTPFFLHTCRSSP